ncbi:unnamed protein product [Parascedosporium putredinis]|uniref:Peptidyl-prolyl cis-trans isomerase n=1 Tax=Parascedosporium putredinis TaxID=1442378 RepID=A0A9P1H997_9PEZI|nr:unnamed protein product [Parascedosporium putredinis]CAI8000689.1 unnamed protein product [Parascedosporium putredinis]
MAKGKATDKKAPAPAKGKGGKPDKDDKQVKGAQSINVRHILCEKHAKKEEALAKLRDGAKFDEVAREFSEDKARQANRLCARVVRWCPWMEDEREPCPQFEEVAFNLEASSTGNPKIGEAKTEFGYHIIMVEGRK